MESDTVVGVSIAVHIQGGPKTAAFSNRLNPFAWFLAHFNAVLFWSHLLSLYSSNSNTMYRHLAKASKPDFAFDDCYGNFSIRCWAEPVWSGFWQQQCIDRREDRGRPRSAWTAANFVLVGDLISGEAWQKVAEASGISEWATSSRTRFAAEQRTSNIFMWKNDACAVDFSWCLDWSQEARMLKKAAVFCFNKVKRVVVFHQWPGRTNLYKTVDEVNRHV